jgi:phage protein D/phage baseplate assembly protein gpV
MPLLPASSPTLDSGATTAHVKVDGRDIGTPLHQNLERVTISASVHLPDLAILEFKNEEREWSDPEEIRIGQEMTIAFGNENEDPNELAFDGEVTAIEVELNQGTEMMIIRGYDRSHRLHRGRKTKVYLNVTDSDIAAQIAQDVGLQTSEIQNTSGVHDYVLQNAESNWEFLKERAALHGFELQVLGRKLVFKPPPSVERDEVELVWHQELKSFRGTMSTGDQVNKVEVRGWDPVDKESILGTAERATKLPEVDGARNGGNEGGSVAQSAFHGEAVMVVAHQPIFSQQEADRLAQSVLDDLSGSFITAQGVAAGNPRLHLGSTVDIQDVGDQFSGKYTVTQITHRYEPEGYEIDFEVTGRRSTDLVSLLERPRRPEVMLLPGLVKDLNDEEGTGRIKVSLPWLGDDIDTFWCRVIAPGAGKERGIMWMPDVDDEVILIGNSMDNLYVLGGVWNGVDAAPYNSAAAGTSSQTHKRTMRSREGHEIVIDDSSDNSGITIVDKEGNAIEIKSSDNSMKIEMAGDIKIKAGGSIELEASANISIKAMSSLTAEATGDATLKGTGSVSAETSGVATLRGASVSLG